MLRRVVIILGVLPAAVFGTWGSPALLPGNVNSAYADWDPCLSPDGQTLYYSSNRSHPGTQDYDIFYCARQGEGWSAPAEVAAGINTAAAELGPNFSWDGKRFYFDRGNLYTQQSDIWVVEISGGEWGTPYKIPGAVNTDEYWESSSTVTADGLTMYFVREYCPGNQGIINIWRSKWTGSAWGPAENVTDVNTADGQCDPALTYDGRYLFYYTFRSGTNPDVYCAKWQGGGWTNIESIPGLNTDAWEISPFVTADGLDLYVSISPQNTNYDLYVCRCENPTIQPTSLGRIKTLFH